MARGGNRAVQRPLYEEIARIVADAAMAGETVRAGVEADRLAAAFSGPGFSTGRIIDEIVAAAAAAEGSSRVQRLSLHLAATRCRT